ncbi:unnamed protein product [Hyaloperonospora brassicae]|uniref:PH domain-containing protein n=1 Tax=Hyaloperonospora brassicae TaxID=162125 RepID=A0AAV0T2Y1_HYABA|nr:unnamed protein product [Hyaloperonospora brassicae]
MVPKQKTASARRATSCASTTSLSVMAGFVRVEMDGEKQRKRSLSASSPCSVATSQGRASANPKVFSRWLYGVLRGDTLLLYWRRTDYKRKTPPLDTLELEMQAAAANESVFGFDNECLYVRVRASGRVVALRIHERKEIVRWVTALYYKSIDSSGSTATTTATNKGNGRTDETRNWPQQQLQRHAVGSTALGTRRKRVSFQEEPQVHVLPEELYDRAELFYSETDYEQFLLERPSQLSSLMSAIYAKTAAKLRVSRKR